MKIDRKSRPVYMSAFGRSVRRLVEQRALTYQEAVDYRGSMARCMKKRSPDRARGLK